MITWDDFQELFAPVYYQIDLTIIALQKMTVSFENVSRTYDGMI